MKELEPELIAQYTWKAPKRKLFYPIIVITLIVFSILATVNTVGVSREVWFDEAFSMQTAHLINEGKEINWAEYDVHPPLYYKTLALWLRIPHSGIMSDSDWARQLSTLFVGFFLIFLFWALRRLYGVYVAGGVVLLLAMTSTYLHFGTEIRMYAMLLLMSVLVLRFIVTAVTVTDEEVPPAQGPFTREQNKSIMKLSVILMASVILFLMPLVHYFATIACFFFATFYVVLGWDKKQKRQVLTRGAILLFSGIAGALVAFFKYALPQMTRSEAMWFQHSSLSSWPSALSYTFYIPQNSLFGNTSVWFFYVFLLIALVAIAKVLFRSAKSIKDRATLLFILTSLFPFLGLAATPIISMVAGPGFGNLYHHRLFLVVTWMFAAGLLIMFFEWQQKLKQKIVSVLSLTAVIFCVLLMTYMYFGTSHHELENTLAAVPCGGVTVAHESPFSGMPAIVYDRERGCDNEHRIISDLTPAQGYTAGYDALSEENILWNLELPEGDFYYIRSWEGLEVIPEEWMTNVYQDAGVGLEFIRRTYAEDTAVTINFG
jgi:uncharacterized membrane protein